MRLNLRRRKIRDRRGEENKGEVKTKGKGREDEKNNEERTGEKVVLGTLALWNGRIT